VEPVELDVLTMVLTSSCGPWPISYVLFFGKGRTEIFS